MSIEEIQAAIAKLPRDEFWRLKEWLSNRAEDVWDNEIEEDARSGKLDRFAKEAMAQQRAGKTIPFPSE